MGRKKIYNPPVGGIIKIKLEGPYHTYGRAIDGTWVAFYDIKTDKDLEIEEIISKTVKYTTTVDETPYDEGLWSVIGVVPLEDWLKKTPPSAKPDVILQRDGSYKTIYVILEGDQMRTTENKEEVLGLEYPVIWSSKNIQQILIDIYSNRVSEIREKKTIR